MIKKSLNRMKNYLYDSTVDLKDRAFMLFAGLLMFALLWQLVSEIIFRSPMSSKLATIIGAIFFILYVWYAFKHDKIRNARVIAAVFIVFIYDPMSFFVSGGASGGTPTWIVMSFLYMVLVLDGRFRVIMCLLNVLTTLACWLLGYFYPSLITEYQRDGIFFDNIMSLYMVSLIVVVMVVYQITLYHRENKLAENKIKEVEEMNKAQNRFFSSMSHEIRTPINTVLGLNEIILRQEDASEEIIKDARNIQGAGKMLLALINDILDVSKIEAGKMDIVPVDYNVAALLSEIVNMILLKAEEKGLKFSVEVDPNVPETLFGDEVRIKQILINLLNNAVKYTKEGSVSLHMECDFPEAEYVYLKISVTDTGMGIKAEALPHLFDTFKRVDEEKNRHIEGTGLGLSIVKQLVELMDGEITVNSVYAQGSTFTVTLKQGKTTDKRIGDINITSSAGMAGDGKFEHSFHAPEARILIVDDNEMNLQVEEKLLKGTQMQVDLALSGREALQLTLLNRYDVIFMDHLMPEMDGIECFEQIRKQKGGLNLNVPIIVLTANAGSENIELYRNTGFDGYLVKPVSGRQLENMLVEKLPEEKVILSDAGGAGGASINTADHYEKKKPVVIAAASMTDLPQNIYRELDISYIPCMVNTAEGNFFDNVDLDAEELIRYMRKADELVLSEPPTEEEFVTFLSQELKGAHHIIFIALSPNSSREYGRALNAAKSFENVTVINSELVSSAAGILVLIAARLVKQGMPVEKIVPELEEAKKRIRGSFVIKSLDIMMRRKLMSPVVYNILNALWLRPILKMQDDKLSVSGLVFGDIRRCYLKYIKRALPVNGGIDTSLLFITYAGVPEEDLVWIEEKVTERVRFDRIVFQKASAGITSNCGEGTFGLIYMVQGDHNYNLGSFFATEADNGLRELSESDAQDVNAADASLAGEDKEKEWYENIEGIDPELALKNSGSEDAFRSVLKIFHDDLDKKYGQLQDYFTTEDWKDYTIKIHALKSSARLIGAEGLAKDAEKLEMAGKANDIDYIRANHARVMSDYGRYKEILRPLFDEPPAAEEPAVTVADPAMMETFYEALKSFVADSDLEGVKAVFEELAEYAFPEEDSRLCEELKAACENGDLGRMSELLEMNNS